MICGLFVVGCAVVLLFVCMGCLLKHGLMSCPRQAGHNWTESATAVCVLSFACGDFFGVLGRNHGKGGPRKNCNIGRFGEECPPPPTLTAASAAASSAAKAVPAELDSGDSDGGRPWKAPPRMSRASRHGMPPKDPPPASAAPPMDALPWPLKMHDKRKRILALDSHGGVAGRVASVGGRCGQGPGQGSPGQTSCRFGIAGPAARPPRQLPLAQPALRRFGMALRPARFGRGSLGTPHPCRSGRFGRALLPGRREITCPPCGWRDLRSLEKCQSRGGTQGLLVLRGSEKGAPGQSIRTPAVVGSPSPDRGCVWGNTCHR